MKPVPMMLECGHWANVQPNAQPEAECDDCAAGVVRSEDIPLPGLDTEVGSS